MKLEDAIGILNEEKESKKHALEISGALRCDGYLEEKFRNEIQAYETVLQEIEHLQKENVELQKENGKLKRARKWFIEHTIGQIATPEMLDKILEDKYISKDKLIETIDFGVQATNTNDEYSTNCHLLPIYLCQVLYMHFLN